MLNLKKGLALVLAAATAFTFAPVAGLDANAATASNSLVGADSAGKTVGDIYLQVGQESELYTSYLKSLGLGSNVDSLSVSTDNKNVATVSASTKISGGTATAGDENTSVSGSTASTLDRNLYIQGVGAGTAHITISDIQPNHQNSIYTQTITVHVNAVGIVQKSTVSKISADLTRINDANGDKYFSVDPNLTNTTDEYAEDATNPNAAKTKFQLDDYNLVSTENYVLEWNTTNADVADFDGEPANKDFTGVTTQSHLVNIKIKSVGAATLSFRLYQSSATDKKSKLVAETNVTVEVKNKVDTLSVSYDANQDGKSETTSLSTSSYDIFDATNDIGVGKKKAAVYDKLPGVYGRTNVTTNPTSATAGVGPYYSEDGNETYVGFYENSGSKVGFATTRKVVTASPTIYLDTDKNTSVQLKATSTLPRNIIYSSSNSYVAVNQDGLVTINKLNLPKDYLDYNLNATISVPVPQQGTGSGTLAGLTINVPVRLSNEQTSDLEVVKANGKTVAKTIGVTNFSDDTSTWGTIYLSTKDKSSETVTIKTGAGTGYVSGAAYAGVNTDTDDVNGIDSDIVSYTGNNTSGTVSLKKDAKPGVAYVKVTAHNNGTNVNNASVFFRVVVTDKSAAAKVSVPNSVINLTASNKTANIGATVSESTTNLKYEFVDAIGSTTSKGTSYGDVSVDQKGNVTYTGSNDGVAYILVSGYETTAALAPDEAYVTVNYSSSKAASTLAVTSDKKVNLKVGDTAQIVASGTAITYTSADPSIATVDATGKITAASNGATVITVASPADDTHMAGQEFVTVIVSQEGEITTKPAKVTGVKVSNKKGAYVSVKWASQGKNINYRVWKKVGNGKWVGKNVAGNKTTLSVKKGAKVQVKVKAYVKDTNGKTTWGPKATKAKTFKTDKK